MAMEVTGSSIIRVADASGRQPLELRVNQRVNANVINVSGDQVDINIRGTRIVGRIVDGSNASALENQRTAQFVVRGMSDGVLELQVVPQQPDMVATGLDAQRIILARNLLQLNGLEINKANMMIGKSLLSLGLPITSDLVESINQALSELGLWGQPEADLAAVLVSKGLPLSSGTLSLALEQLPGLADAFQNLESRLASFLNSNAAKGNLKALAEQAANVLREGVIDWSSQPADLMNQLDKAVSLWGKSIESHLADILAQGGNDLNDNGLLVFANLRNALIKTGENRLSSEIDRFLDSIRQMQFNNTSNSKDPTNPPWLLIDIPISEKAKDPMPNKQSANLRIAYRPNDEGKRIDPDNNRLILSVDLDEENTLEVDISMVGKRIGAWLTVTDEDWRSMVEEELPSLQDGLEKLGYFLQFARCEVKLSSGLTDKETIATKKVDLKV